MVGVDVDEAVLGVTNVMVWSPCGVVSGKRERGDAVCASLQSRHPVSAAGLPVVKLSVDGASCHALVDSGCSHCIVHAPYCASWTRKRADVMTMSGERQRCEGVGRVQLRVCNGDSVVVDVYVVDFKPLGFEFILGVNGISALGGVTISHSLAMHFGSADEKPICAVATQVDKIVGAGVTQAEKTVGAGVTQAEKTVGTGVTQAKKTVGTGVTQVKKTVFFFGLKLALHGRSIISLCEHCRLTQW